MRTNFILGAALLASVVTTAQAAPELVKNGGFERVVGGPGYSHEFGAGYKYGDTVVGWSSPASTAFNVIFYPGQANGKGNDHGNASTKYSPGNPGGQDGQYLWTSTPSPFGGKFVALDGDNRSAANPGGTLNPVVGEGNGPLQQTISRLRIGHTYTVSFDYAGAQYRDRTGATTDELYTTFGGVQKSTGTFNNDSMGFTGWKTWSSSFTATAKSQLLSFLSVGTPSGLPPVILLDGVSVKDTSNIVVPEPAMLGVLGLGLAGLAGLARLRRR